MSRFEIDEPREGRADREPLRIARVDAGHQGLAEALHRLRAEAAAHEGRDRLVFGARRRADGRGRAPCAACPARRRGRCAGRARCAWAPRASCPREARAAVRGGARRSCASSGLVGISRSPRPSARQRARPSGFWARIASGPPSRTNPPVARCGSPRRSEARPPGEAPSRPASRSARAAASPAMPPPTTTTSARGRGHDSRTRSARARMKVGEVLSDSVRPSVDAEPRARPARPGRRCRTGSRCGRRRSRRARPGRGALPPSRPSASASSSGGPSHGSGVRPALW